MGRGWVAHRGVRGEPEAWASRHTVSAPCCPAVPSTPLHPSDSGLDSTYNEEVNRPIRVVEIVLF